MTIPLEFRKFPITDLLIQTQLKQVLGTVSEKHMVEVQGLIRAANYQCSKANAKMLNSE